VTSPVVVAIDGPAGTGKSTVAKTLARRLGIPYLDTGAMYRALALRALERGVDPDDRAAVASVVAGARLDLHLGTDGHARVVLDGEPVEGRIRTPEVSAATSRLAVHPEVRDRMVELQRELARRHGGVIEGRDIGTRVVPETPHKFFLTADPAVRAARRYGDLSANGNGADLERVTRELAERDARDQGRALAPLVPAPGAVSIDTTAMSADEVVESLFRSVTGR
jgi:cytidylate kinase